MRVATGAAGRRRRRVPGELAAELAHAGSVGPGGLGQGAAGQL